jgi:hypothetical protein
MQRKGPGSMTGMLAPGFDLARYLTTQAIERTARLLIGLQLEFMQGRDDFLAQQLDRTLHIRMGHGPLIAVDV